MLLTTFNIVDQSRRLSDSECVSIGCICHLINEVFQSTSMYLTQVE